MKNLLKEITLEKAVKPKTNKKPIQSSIQLQSWNVRENTEKPNATGENELN